MENFIDVTDCDLITLVKAAYHLSRPQGLGFLHHKPGHELSDDEAKEIIARYEGSTFEAVAMDYVHGRAVKLRVWIESGRRYIRNRWYDHSTDDLRALLTTIGLSPDLATA